jgi:hypothetical protein
VSFIAPASSNGTRLTTNSPVDPILRGVSFTMPLGWCKGEIIRVGGDAVMTWKKLKGPD